RSFWTLYVRADKSQHGRGKSPRGREKGFTPLKDHESSRLWLAAASRFADSGEIREKISSGHKRIPGNAKYRRYHQNIDEAPRIAPGSADEGDDRHHGFGCQDGENDVAGLRFRKCMAEQDENRIQKEHSEEELGQVGSRCGEFRSRFFLPG